MFSTTTLCTTFLLAINQLIFGILVNGIIILDYILSVSQKEC